MKKVYKALSVATHALLSAVGSLAVLNVIIYVIPLNLLVYFGGEGIDRSDSINYAPEVWLALLAFVFGTLIIVISIAAESTPKLIDLFIKDYKSRYYIWVITLSILENVFLQLLHTQHSLFVDNSIFLNNYILLPCFIILAIPYIFYILRYTKSLNVINKIYDENRLAIRMASKIENSRTKINQSHIILFETISQLHDLLQFVKFKEPKGEIINKFGKSLRFYLERKKMIHESYFILSYSVKNDISFKTLIDKFDLIEKEKTFYEKKVLRIFASSYLMLIQEGHFDLASQCGNELFEIGKTAIDLNEENATEEVIIHFNTQLRYGINHGLKTKEIRNVYNTMFHYSQLVSTFIKRHDERRIIQLCEYFTFYGKEVTKLSLSEPSFSFLIDAFAMELKKILIDLYDNNFSRDIQVRVIKMFDELSSRGLGRMLNGEHINDSGVRLIQIALCLFYMERGEKEFNEITINSMLEDLVGFDKDEAKDIIARDCVRIKHENEKFWEETDQGNRNIFYSAHKNQLSNFNSYIYSKIDTDISIEN